MLDEIIKRVRNLNHDQQKEMLGILNDWQVGKQREYQRLKARANIDVEFDDRVIQTDAGDISASGIFIKTSGKFEPDTILRMVFSIPGIDKSYKLQGTVVRVEENGFAVNFENITPYFKKLLDTAIWESNNLGDDRF
ncbi:PilZ domain-containing protein [Desulfobacula sp.]